MALLTNALKSSFVKEFYKSITDPRSADKYYIFYGGVKSREDETVVPDALNTVEEENTAKRNTMFYTHILPSDVSLMVPRYDWTAGTIYDQYEDDLDLSDKKYYVMVLLQNEYRVYMCLSNNNGSVSTVSPEGTNTQEILTSDGYIWKFMYSLTEQMEKFITESYIPIVEIGNVSYSDERALALDVKLDAVSGFIEKITVDGTSVSFTDLVNPSMNSTHTVSTVNDLVFTVNLLSDLATSSNYYNNNYIVYFDSGKIGTIKTYTVSGNTATIELCEIYPDNGGTNNIETGDVYSILPKVNVVGNGYGAVVLPVFQNNLLSSISIINGGSGYNFANAYLLSGPNVDISVVIPPDGGYGYDIINELRPRHLLIKKEFKYSDVSQGAERLFGVGSSIRQYGIIKNIMTNEDFVVPQNYQQYDMTLIVDPSTTIVGDNYSVNGVLDFNSTQITSQSTHIIGADTFSSAKIEQISLNPSNPRLFNLRISDSRGIFEKAKLNQSGSVILGERIVFVNKTQSGISNNFQLISAPKSVYGFTQSELPLNIPANIRTSVIQKLKLVRANSSTFDDFITPPGSYLYREPYTSSGNDTIDAAAAYVLSVGTREIVGSDTTAYVYVLAEKGSFSVGDDLSCVVDPFVKGIQLFSGSCAGNSGVSVSVEEEASTYDSIVINKYSGTVLYIQNIQKLDLSSNSVFTTRTLLGF
jgi:hypothetical protein